MSAQIATPPNQWSYLNIIISEKGLSEFSDGKRIIFIPKEQVQLIEIKFGSHAERPLMQVILGLLLIVLGFAGVYLVLIGGLRGLYWGLGLIGFGGIGVLCLYEAIKKGHYLYVTCLKDARKLKFTGEIKKTELSKFIKDASSLGYGFRDCLNDKVSI
jgi:hypothetical protein